MKNLSLLLALLVAPLTTLAADPVAPCLQDARLLKGDVAKGKEAYVVCRGCHKADGTGRPEAGYPQLAGQHASVLAKQMLDVRCARRDNPRMHPFVEAASVPYEDIADIAAYLAALPQPDNISKGPGNAVAQGETLYKRDCAVCHGAQGQGDASKFLPRVAGQHYFYLRRETLDIRAKARRNADAEMIRVLANYSDADIDAVSDFMSRMKPTAP
jgi:cytochrome c553